MKRCTGNQPDPNHFESHQLLSDSIEGSTKCGGAEAPEVHDAV
ncbi:hypothetical protein SBC2_81460 (plasmid) [Caballeronia sp. SBC2]|nr:hypothetical protein SBC2_81460 [Caballeronia sp. SBC2]